MPNTPHRHNKTNPTPAQQVITRELNIAFTLGMNVAYATKPHCPYRGATLTLAWCAGQQMRADIPHLEPGRHRPEYLKAVAR